MTTLAHRPSTNQRKTWDSNPQPFLGGNSLAPSLLTVRLSSILSLQTQLYSVPAFATVLWCLTHLCWPILPMGATIIEQVNYSNVPASIRLPKLSLNLAGFFRQPFHSNKFSSQGGIRTHNHYFLKIAALPISIPDHIKQKVRDSNPWTLYGSLPFSRRTP